MTSSNVGQSTSEPLTPLCALFEIREALGDLILESRVQGYDPEKGPSHEDPMGSLGRTRAAIEEADRLLDSQAKTPVRPDLFAGAQGQEHLS